MKHTPYIHMVWPIDVENQVRVARERPSTQSRQIEFVRVARRACARVAADVDVGFFKRIDEAKRCLWRILAQVVGKGLVNVPIGLRPRDDRLGLHF